MLANNTFTVEFSALYPNLSLLLIFLIVGAAVGVFLSFFSAKRTMLREVPASAEDETRVVEAAFAYPVLAAYMTVLPSKALTVPQYQDLHTLYCESVKHLLDPQQRELLEKAVELDEKDPAGANILRWNLGVQFQKDHANTILDEVEKRVNAVDDVELHDAYQYVFAQSEILRANDKELAQQQLVEHTKMKEVLKAFTPTQMKALDSGTNVGVLAQERVLYVGMGGIEDNPEYVFKSTEQNTLRRVYQRPSRLRQLLTGLTSALCAGLIPAVVYANGYADDKFAAILIAAALMVLLASSVVIALVDIDTLFIDRMVWFLGTVVCWSLVAATAVVQGEYGSLLKGVAAFVTVAVLFEVTTKIYTLVRGREGQGFGDTLIIMITVGIPTAVTGDLGVGYFALMGGLVAGIIWWLFQKLFQGATKETPFAFGPGLTLGSAICLTLSVTGIDSLILGV